MFASSKNIPFYCKRTAKQMIVLLLIYQLTRLVFYFFNHVYFANIPIYRLMIYLFAGLRFDICAILLTNLPFIVLSVLPFGGERSIYRRYLLPTLFFTVNSSVLLMQFGDTIFFQYQFKRSTADIFRFLELGSDTADVLPSVIRSYWYMFALWCAFVALMWYLYKRTLKLPLKALPDNHHYIAASISSYIITAAVAVIGLRGGWQLNSAEIIDAAGYGPARDIALIINTPFSLAKTLDAAPLTEYHFFDSARAQTLYSAVHKPAATGMPFRKLNVVTIILESFSKEYIDVLNKRHSANTPFLDSLIGQSLVCDNAYSDGKKSIEGIPSVVAGLPSWMDGSFITSNYNKDNFSSLASLLAKENYTTAFFHGGTNGTMGFTTFCNNARFKYYYGRSEFNNDRYYDGHWGIWDQTFLQYFAKNVDTLRQPFYAALFTLSSHEPYSIPDSLKSVYYTRNRELPILKCVRYSDMALRRFFNTAEKMAWFDSTLFVITADHAGPSRDAFYSNRVGMYAIPVIFYMHHSPFKGKLHETVQQIDIMPSVLDMLHYPYPYFAFGRSIFDTSRAHFAVNYLNDCYEIISGKYALQFQGQRCMALYNYQRDSMLNNDLRAEIPEVKDSLSTLLKAVLQEYSSDIIRNKMISH